MIRVNWLLAIGLTIAAFLASVALYNGLPESIPTHWNIRGEIDHYGSKQWALFSMPAAMLALMGLFAALPWLSPRRFEVGRFRPTYLYIMVVLVGLMGYIHSLMLYSAWSGQRSVARAMVGGIFLVFALTGNVLGKVRPNFYMGVRTPWTLASERVWNDTHRVTAWLFVCCGLIGFVIALTGFFVAAFALLLVLAAVPILYSLVLYKQYERRGEL